METNQKITTNARGYAPATEMEKVKRVASREFKITSSAILWGTMAGLIMAAYLLFLNMFGGGSNIVLNFLKYIPLAVILYLGLSKYRNFNLETSFFQNAMLLGILTSFISSIVLVITSLLVSAAEPDWTFNQYYMPIDSIGDSFATSGTLFFEVHVLGAIITFVCVQYLKGRDEHVVDTIDS